MKNELKWQHGSHSRSWMTSHSLLLGTLDLRMHSCTGHVIPSEILLFLRGRGDRKRKQRNISHSAQQNQNHNDSFLWSKLFTINNYMAIVLVSDGPPQQRDHRWLKVDPLHHSPLHLRVARIPRATLITGGKVEKPINHRIITVCSTHMTNHDQCQCQIRCWFVGHGLWSWTPEPWTSNSTFYLVVLSTSKKINLLVQSQPPPIKQRNNGTWGSSVRTKSGFNFKMFRDRGWWS